MAAVEAMPRAAALLRFTVEQREQISRELPIDFYRWHDEAKLIALERHARRAGVAIPERYVGPITSRKHERQIEFNETRRRDVLSALWSVFVKAGV